MYSNIASPTEMGSLAPPVEYGAKKKGARGVFHSPPGPSRLASLSARRFLPEPARRLWINIALIYFSVLFS